jgi:hypothetical protein
MIELEERGFTKRDEFFCKMLSFIMIQRLIVMYDFCTTTIVHKARLCNFSVIIWRCLEKVEFDEKVQKNL